MRQDGYSFEAVGSILHHRQASLGTVGSVIHQRQAFLGKMVILSQPTDLMSNEQARPEIYWETKLDSSYGKLDLEDRLECPNASV